MWIHVHQGLEDSAGVLQDAAETLAKLTTHEQGVTINLATDADFVNGLYLRKYGQKCSGERGNACSGEIVDEWVNIQNCKDLDKAIGQDERCEAPFDPTRGVDIYIKAIDILNYRTLDAEAIDPQTKNSCFRYEPNIPALSGDPGKKGTFEKSFLGLASADGWCAPKACVSGEGDNKYNAPFNGKVLCFGTCDGNGVCDYAYNCECSSHYCGTDLQCDGKTPSTAKGVPPFTGISPPPPYTHCCGQDCMLQFCKQPGDWLVKDPNNPTNNKCVKNNDCDKDGCIYTTDDASSNDKCKYTQATLVGDTCWYDFDSAGDYCDIDGGGCEATSKNCPEFLYW